ncbi:MAG: cell division protein ZapA [Elusimicrobia bacterium]|nr:cell division protein ZapA [Elusimicrobiota bacterium]
MKDTFEIEICKRRYNVEVEGMTHMEVSMLAKEVEDKMLSIEARYGTPDTSKLAVLTALEFAMAYTQLKESCDLARDTAEKKLVELDHVLRAAVDAAAPSK